MIKSSCRARTGPGNPGKYLNFSLAFGRTGKSLKMVGGPGKSWKSVNLSNNVFLKDIEEQPHGKIQQLINTKCACIMDPGKKRFVRPGKVLEICF